MLTRELNAFLQNFWPFEISFVVYFEQRHLENKMCVEHKMPPIRPIPKIVKVTRTDILIPVGKSCHKK